MHMGIVQIHFQRYKTGFDYCYQARVTIKVWPEEDYMIIRIRILNAKQISTSRPDYLFEDGRGEQQLMMLSSTKRCSGKSLLLYNSLPLPSLSSSIFPFN